MRQHQGWVLTPGLRWSGSSHDDAVEARILSLAAGQHNRDRMATPPDRQQRACYQRREQRAHGDDGRAKREPPNIFHQRPFEGPDGDPLQAAERFEQS